MDSGTILVTGGAGYIGSHIVRRLREDDRAVVVLDDLREGHRAAVGDVPLIEGDIGDGALLDRELRARKVTWIVHMAASCQVGGSVEDPASYYDNNVRKSLDLIDAARRGGVRGIVFSSTAAVYGEPLRTPIDEDHPKEPTNPYGETKWAIERALAWYARAYDLRYVALRYFNAAGAHPDGDLGEDHEPETHLLPILLRVARDGGDPARVFGTDWPTPDGTCVRDYVHVVDLADAHVRAIDAMADGTVHADAFNLGSGDGFSVREVIDVVRRITGRPLATVEAPRRPGDPATLVASSERARRVLGWEPRLADLETIVETAWRWHRDRPRGWRDA